MSSALFISEVVAEPLPMRGTAFIAGFFFSFRFAITFLGVQLLGLDPSTATALGIGIDLLLLGLVCFDTPGATHTAYRSLTSIPSFRWVLAFLTLSLCSLFWSDTASVLNSAVYWTGLATDVAVVAMLFRNGSAASVSQSMMKGFIWSACCLAVIAWIIPAQPDLRLGNEDYFNANEIGNVCAFAIFFAQYLMRRKDGAWWLPTLFLAITLLRSLSKTTIVAFFVSECVLFIRDKSISRKVKVRLALLAGGLFLAFLGLFEAYYNVYTTAGNQAETVTGRTAIWLYVLNAVSDHPWTLWIGHGFDSWWKVVPPFGNGLFEARHGENEILQQLYAYGVAGVVVLGGVYGSLYRQLRRLQQGPTRLLLLCLLLFILIRGLAEADAFDLLLPLWSVVLIGVIAEDQRLRWKQRTAISGSATDPPAANCHPIVISGVSPSI